MVWKRKWGWAVLQYYKKTKYNFILFCDSLYDCIYFAVCADFGGTADVCNVVDTCVLEGTACTGKYVFG